MFGLVEFWLRVILLPATKANALEEAVLTVPEVAPPNVEVIVVSTEAPAPGVGPMIVMAGEVEFWLRVMFDPARNGNADEEAVFAVPSVAPPAALEIETSVE
jgi:hypothetical protein